MAASKNVGGLSEYMEAVARRHQVDTPPGYGYKAAVGGEEGVNIGFLVEATSGCQVLEKPVIIPSGKPDYQGYMMFYAYCAQGGIEHLLGGNMPEKLPATTKDPRAFGSKEAIAKNFGNKDPKGSAAAGNSDYCVAIRVPPELVVRVEGLSDDYDLWMIRIDQSLIMPFLSAAKSGNAALVTKGLEAGIDAKTVDEDLVPVLTIAAFSGSLETCQVLLSKGADANAAEPTNGRTALMAAAQAGAAPIVQLLLSAGANPSAADSEGQTALMWAATANKAETAKFLAAKGIKDIKNNQGLTALQVAEKMGHADTVAALK